MTTEIATAEREVVLVEDAHVRTTRGLDIHEPLSKGGTFSTAVPSDFNGLVYLLEGEADCGANRLHAGRSQTDSLGQGAP